jgi:hypothetical protein
MESIYIVFTTPRDVGNFSLRLTSVCVPEVVFSGYQGSVKKGPRWALWPIGWWFALCWWWLWELKYYFPLGNSIHGVENHIYMRRAHLCEMKHAEYKLETIPWIQEANFHSLQLRVLLINCTWPFYHDILFFWIQMRQDLSLLMLQYLEPLGKHTMLRLSQIPRTVQRSNLFSLSQVQTSDLQPLWFQTR